MDLVKGTIQIRDVMFFYFINFLGAFHSKRSSCASQYIQIYLFSWRLLIILTIRPAFPTSVKKVNTSFKNVWRTWGLAFSTLLADLMIFCPLGLMGPTNLKKLCNFILVFDSTQARNHYVTFKACTLTTTPQMWLIL